MTQPDLVLLSSGRRVAVHTVAAGTGQRTVLLFHPAPGSANFDPDPTTTAKRQVTLIAVDRPGYGASPPVLGGEWASVASAADDAAEVLRRRSVGPVGVAGWSAGGRVALALAARHPDLVDRVVILATPAPDDEVPWVPEEHRRRLEALRDLPADEVRQRLAALLDAQTPADGPIGTLLAALGRSPADDDALTQPGAIDRLDGMLRAALAQGVAGLAADIAGYTLRPWGFEPAGVRAKVLCLYGSRDPGIASRHGTWWQKHLPQARLEMVPGAGHLLILPMWSRVLSFLAPGRR